MSTYMRTVFPGSLLNTVRPDGCWSGCRPPGGRMVTGACAYGLQAYVRLVIGLQATAAARGLAAGRRVVEVELGGVRRDVLHVVGLGGVEVLHQMLPLAPPAHLGRAPARPVGAKLHDEIVPHLAVGQELGVPAGGKSLLLVLTLPHEHQHVAVWQRCHVVMR
eukprot:scaffold54632_cov60-Phaeocystis_antarctica.AAC.3